MGRYGRHLLLVCVCSTLLCGVSMNASAQQKVEREVPEEDALFKTRSLEQGARDEGGGGRDDDAVRTDELDDTASREELRAAGFRFGDYSGSRRRSTAFLMALFPGLLLHGAGHLYLGERETAFALAMMELGGLTMMGVGAVLPLAFSGRLAESGASRPVFYTGMGLIISSYVIDVVGVTRGPKPVLYASPLMREGLSLELGYEFLQTRFYPLRNVINGRLNVDTGGGFFRGNTLQDVSLLTSGYAAELGWRPVRITDTEHQVFLMGTGELLQFRDVGRFSRLEVGGQVGGVLDLGVLTPQLRRAYLGMRTGYNFQWYAFPENVAPEVDVRSDSPPPLDWESTGIGGVPMAIFGGMSFTENLHIQLAYTRRDGGFLNDINRLFAVPSVHVDYRSGRNFDLTFDAEYGSGFSLAAGLRIWIYEKSRRR